MGFDLAVCRLIELGQIERGAQLEAAGLLLARDGDCGQEGSLGEGGVDGGLFKQDFAARAVVFRQETMLTVALALGDPFVNDR